MAKHTDLSRRRFLEYMAGAGALMGGSCLLPWWPVEATAQVPSGRKETRTYVFNLRHLETDRYDFVLVAGRQRIDLSATTPGAIRRLRSKHAILAEVPDEHLTHHVALEMPADALQLCYLQRFHRGKRHGIWHMGLVFYHHPASALAEAARRRRGAGRRPAPGKWGKYGLVTEGRRGLDALAESDALGEEVLQDSDSHAVALVAGHPELACGDPDSAAHIQGNIIGTQPSVSVLSQSLTDQGAATQSGGWATMTPLVDPTTGDYYLNSQGQIQYVPMWSQETGFLAGQAIQPSLDAAKDDPSLGVNVTDIDSATGAATAGAIWTVHDGMSTVSTSASAAARAPLAAGALSYQLTDESPDHGYSVKVDSVATDSQGKVTIDVSFKNWYVRYLSLYVRYLDANGDAIALSTLGSEIKDLLPDYDGIFSGQHDAYLDMLPPEFTVIGIPVDAAQLKKTLPLPAAATSVQVLASGIGSGKIEYGDTVGLGIAMTAIFNLGVPAILLGVQAAAGYSFLIGKLAEKSTLAAVLPWAKVFYDAYEVLFEDVNYNAQTLALDLGQALLDTGAEAVDLLIAEAMAEGLATEAVEDAIPLVGGFLSAIWAAGLVANIAETSAEVATSPITYVDTITFTHDVAVSIAHDPDDPAGFPATASSYTVTALFDGGTPRTSTGALQGTTTAPIAVTFTDVPAGGQVKVDVGFYSDTGYLVGQGTVGPVDNAATAGTLALSITITELLVPLTGTTRYSHKEVIALDSAGNHTWKPTPTPPSTVLPEGRCDNVNGHICSWSGITISTLDAAVGYAWQAYNGAVRDCASGASGQLHQFASISTSESPQSGYLFSGCGFSGRTRVVYDLMGKKDWNFYLDTASGGNYIRQVRLGSSPSFDAPGSNRAWGKLQFPSDALLLHPLGKIISVNTALNKLEVLDLPRAATSDAAAPLSQVRSGAGTREGLMKGPVHAAVTAQGTILVLESTNNRIQAFDIGGNPVSLFSTGYFAPLHDVPTGGAYLDLAVEYSGYIYVLSYTGSSGSYTYRLDIYTPDGAWLARTTGVNADKLAVNYWRDLFTLNYETLTLPGGAVPSRTEPSVSHWIPSTP